MIVALVSDPFLCSAVVRAAHPEEDVVWDRDLVVQATELGTPRLVVHHSDDPWGRWLVGLDASLPLVTLSRAMLRNWESERLKQEIPVGRIDYLTLRMADILDLSRARPTWVDRALADLGRASGGPLPDPLRGFARRVLEFPCHYDDLRPVASACGLSRGALKARFRRRGLASPAVYLRWFRVIASAYLLSDRSVSIADAAHRMGYTSPGNFCRSVQSLTGLTPTEVRTVRGWNRLLVAFAWEFLGAGSLRAWEDLQELFTRVA